MICHLPQMANHMQQNPANVDNPQHHARDLTAEDEEEESESCILFLFVSIKSMSVFLVW